MTPNPLLTEVERSARQILDNQPSLIPLVEAKTHAFMVTQYREAAHHFVWHYHPEAELVWIRQGRGWRFVGQSVEHFEPGDLVLLGGDVPHAWASVKDRSEKAIWTVIHFSPERWGAQFWGLPEAQSLRRLLDKAAHGLQFRGAERWDVGQAVEELTALRTHDLESLIKFLGICQRLVHTPHSRLNAASAGGPKTEPNPRLHHLLEWLQRKASEPVSQTQAAAQAKMSPAAFSRWFKARVGCVFHRYLNEMRVAMCQRWCW